MYYSIPSHLSDLPIYKKAIEILTLSQKISGYMHYDLAPLKKDGSEDNDIYFTGDIIQQSVSLGPEIINAEINKTQNTKKYKHLKSLKSLTRRLYKSCNRLEASSSNGKDYIPILKRELKHFNKLQKQWMLTL